MTPPRARSWPLPYASAFPWFLLRPPGHVRGRDQGLRRGDADYWSKRPAVRSWAPGRRTVKTIVSRGRPAGTVGRRVATIRRSRPCRCRRTGADTSSRRVVEFWQGREDRVHTGFACKGQHRNAPAVVRKLFADTTPLRTRDFGGCGCRHGHGIAATLRSSRPVQLYALTQNRRMAGFPAVALVPLVVFGLWGGAWADAMDRGCC